MSMKSDFRIHIALRKKLIRIFKTLLCNVANNLLNLSVDPSYLNIYLPYVMDFLIKLKFFSCSFGHFIY